MSSIGKIPLRGSGSAVEGSRRCPYCGSPRCWKHGTYRRKGFHYLAGGQTGQEPIAVPRSICRRPSCERTFSVLPDTVLPCCRFHLDGLLSIAGERTDGKSSYEIAKHQWDLSLRVVLRAVALVDRMVPILERLCREVAGGVASGFGALVTTVRETCSWCDITRALFRGLYPCRSGKILNPHKVGISPG